MYRPVQEVTHPAGLLDRDLDRLPLPPLSAPLSRRPRDLDRERRLRLSRDRERERRRRSRSLLLDRDLKIGRIEN